MQADAGQPAASGTLARSESMGAWGAWLGGRQRTGGRADCPAGPVVYMHSETGRRPAYLHVLERLFGARRGRVRDLFLSRAAVIFLAVEETFFLYVLVALVRALAGRRTVGLLLRPMPIAVSPRLRCRFRRMVLRAMKRCRTVRTLTIVPFNVFPAFSTIADDWIYDFQLWDVTEEEREAVEQLRRERRPGNRFVMTALGTQSRGKGFDLFSDAFARFSVLRKRFTFLACGKVSPDIAEYALVLEEAGGVAVDRALSHAELLGAYAASDAIWCFYPRAGDHACGILGRAVQLGIPVVVRQGSLAHRLCTVENLLHIAVAPEQIIERLTGPLPPQNIAWGRYAARRFAQRSEATLREAFGMAPEPAAKTADASQGASPAISSSRDPTTTTAAFQEPP